MKTKRIKFTGDHKQISRNGRVILHVDPAGERTYRGRLRLTRSILKLLNK